MKLGGYSVTDYFTIICIYVSDYKTMYQGNDKNTQIKSIESAFFNADFEHVLVYWDINRKS